jgi:4'-phosphopantetheinyl transferase
MAVPTMKISWLVRGEDAVPAGDRWLTRAEAATAAAARFTKRRDEYRLRRLVAKHAVAAVAGLPADDAALARVEVRHEPGGAPYAVLDGVRIDGGITLSDRAGWAACAIGPPGLGCDLELVEPRSDAFVRAYLTHTERQSLAGLPGAARPAVANLIWSAKESALKALGTGLDRDTRDVDVNLVLGQPAEGGWSPLTVRCADGAVLPGWWRRDGRFVVTVASTRTAPPPVALEDPTALATAVPRASWLTRPLAR